MVTEGHYHLFTASSTATIVAGESYFCNNVMGNEDPMLEVGDPEMLTCLDQSPDHVQAANCLKERQFHFRTPSRVDVTLG